MAPETMIDPQALYEAEIKRKQGELSLISSELNKAIAQKQLVNDEVVKLHSDVEKSKEKLANLEVSIKKAEDDFKTHNAKSIALLEKRDLESQDRQTKAEKAEQAEKAEKTLALQAKNNVVAIAQDIAKTVEKIVGLATSLKTAVDSELKDYLALADPKAAIPDPKLKK